MILTVIGYSSKILPFFDDICYDHAGGGVDVGYLFSLTTNYSITSESCTFHKNKAAFGGGISIISTPSLNMSNKDHISLKDCHWSRNVAEIGVAIDTSPHIWLSPGFDPNTQIQFSDCTTFRIREKQCILCQREW